jgi:hypothetical protein
MRYRGLLARQYNETGFFKTIIDGAGRRAKRNVSIGGIKIFYSQMRRDARRMAAARRSMRAGANACLCGASGQCYTASTMTAIIHRL